MILKEEHVNIYPRKASKGIPIKMTVHWDTDLKEYVLCKINPLGLGYVHFTLEEVQDMRNILIKYKEVKLK